MVKTFNHASKFPSCVSKSKVNGSMYHPFISGQNHGIICDANFGLLCYSNSFYLGLSRSKHNTFALIS